MCRHKEEETITYILYKHVISSILISLTLRKLKRDNLKSRTRIMNRHQQSCVTHQWFNTMFTILCNRWSEKKFVIFRYQRYLNSINIISRNRIKTPGKFEISAIDICYTLCTWPNYITGPNVQIWVNTLIVQLSTDTRMSVLLLGSSHINRLKHYVNKLQQQEFNLDGNIIIKLFGINGGRIGNNDHCRRLETYIEQVKPMHII